MDHSLREEEIRWIFCCPHKFKKWFSFSTSFDGFGLDRGCLLASRLSTDDSVSGRTSSSTIRISHPLGIDFSGTSQEAVVSRMRTMSSHGVSSQKPFVPKCPVFPPHHHRANPSVPSLAFGSRCRARHFEASLFFHCRGINETGNQKKTNDARR